jgi:hypothetical protein
MDGSEPIMATSVLCTWGGFAMQVISAGVLHLWPKHRWVGWLLLGAGWLVFVAAFVRWYSDRHPGMEFLWIAIAGGVLPPLIIFMWFERPFQGNALWSRYCFQWPIKRRRGWPHNAPLTHRVNHIRTSFCFDKFEKEDIIGICLVFANTTFEDVFIESVSGSLYYDQLGEEASPPLALVGTTHPPIIIKPIDTATVELEQRVPTKAALRLRDAFTQRKSVSFQFWNLHIRIRSKATGEVIRAILWQGTSCRISDLPITHGVLVFSDSTSSVGWSGSEVRK